MAEGKGFTGSGSYYFAVEFARGSINFSSLF